MNNQPMLKRKTNSGNSRNIQIVDLRRHWHHITFILTAALTFQCKTKLITYNTIQNKTIQRNIWKE
ncbi:hypothetical protein T08_8979 [Trichinella sp. T8]|nr:hypothetical protein T08_8979 [Trichinella sp. T8]